jgi:hypothetical protein
VAEAGGLVAAAGGVRAGALRERIRGAARFLCAMSMRGWAWGVSVARCGGGRLGMSGGESMSFCSAGFEIKPRRRG